MNCQNWLMPMRFMPLLSTPTSSTASSVPPIVPRPPDVDAPPRKTAVIARSSYPWLATSALAEPVRAAMTSPPIAARAPESMYSIQETRRVAMPDRRAARSLPPTA